MKWIARSTGSRGEDVGQDDTIYAASENGVKDFHLEYGGPQGAALRTV